ncbi:MAG TPA: NAD(P)H-hydrate dehydratase [Verrucomicrobiae bacterium]|jgi:NAD(P)H-hydrate epimerase|nr:NAD(P)H-hydrate dehydratase [Verrucomicrobiae bacterium]
MSVPIISVPQMREWEKATWAAGQTESAVIARVGEAVAQRTLQSTSPGDAILILAGKGHNGDDARQAESHLRDRRVLICSVNDPAADLAAVTQQLEESPALIVDGLFGIGINRPLDEKWQALIQRVNDSRIPILAVDVPSGLNAETGEPEGAAIRAAITLTVGAPKKGMLLPPAWPYVGRLEVATDVGLAKCPFTGEINWILPRDFRNFPPARPAVSHKGDYGHLGIFAGSLGYHGAAVLTSRGAQHAQPGLITLHTPETVYHVVASQLQAVMVRIWEPTLKMPDHYGAVLIGPGLAAENLPDAVKMFTRLTWRDSPVPVVVDASALDWVPVAPLPKTAIRVITPHPGEAARLLRTAAQHVQADRSGALREISKRHGNCWVVLKGAQTLIGRSEGPIAVNSSGNPRLAQGGSGDVLSGYLSGLLAQRALQADTFTTLCYGVWQHGAAADRLSAVKPNWVVEDLVVEIGNCQKHV